MQESAKYLIHADITANGVVERSDVVGAVFGQTEGLLGQNLDIRELQESSRLGRIDVEISSESGASFGSITIASGLDRVQTAILAAALESIERVGPCRATVEVSGIEDVRSAKRRQVVERAKELLAEFDETALTNDELVEEVRQSLRIEDITEYEGLPAGPRVAESDATVVVEGRADVLRLLRYGVKNAIAVEGTNVPDAVADLTAERTVTAFLDGDRGGTLILKELAQVGDIDYVAFAPEGRSVEDLSHTEVMRALREKVPYSAIEDESDLMTPAATDGSTRPAPPEVSERGPASTDDADESEPAELGALETGNGESAATEPPGDPAASAGDAEVGASSGHEDEAVEPDDSVDAPRTLAGHVERVVAQSSGRARLLDGDCDVLADVESDAAFDAVESAETVPRAVVTDGEVTQRLLDVAAQRGVGEVVGREAGEFVKQPTSVRLRLADEFG